MKQSFFGLIATSMVPSVLSERNIKTVVKAFQGEEVNLKEFFCPSGFSKILDHESFQIDEYFPQVWYVLQFFHTHANYLSGKKSESHFKKVSIDRSKLAHVTQMKEF